MSNTFHIRLKQGRLMRGLSLKELAEKLDNKVSASTLSKIEAGLEDPEGTWFMDLADVLNVHIDYLFRPILFSIDSLGFEDKLKLKKKELNILKEEVRDQIERYIDIETLLQLPYEFKNPLVHKNIKNIKVKEPGDGSIAADKIFLKWDLEEKGFYNVIETLEGHNIHVIEVEADPKFESISGLINGKIAVIVLNATLPDYEKRYYALKELGNIVMNFDPELPKRKREELCFEFASSMSALREALNWKSGIYKVTSKGLIDINKQDDIPIGALNLRAHKSIEGTVDSKKKETDSLGDINLPPEILIQKEHSTKFERLVFQALDQEIITISKAAVLLNSSINDILDNEHLR